MKECKDCGHKSDNPFWESKCKCKCHKEVLVSDIIMMIAIGSMIIGSGVFLLS